MKHGFMLQIELQRFTVSKHVFSRKAFTGNENATVIFIHESQKELNAALSHFD